MPTEPPLSEDAEETTAAIFELLVWVPLVLTSLFVATLPILHLWISGKARLLPASVVAKLSGETGGAYAAWVWTDTHRVVGWAYCVLLVAASYVVARGRRKLRALVALAVLLMPALWYWGQASFLGERLLLNQVK